MLWECSVGSVILDAAELDPISVFSIFPASHKYDGLQRYPHRYPFSKLMAAMYLALASSSTFEATPAGIDGTGVSRFCGVTWMDTSCGLLERRPHPGADNFFRLCVRSV